MNLRLLSTLLVFGAAAGAPDGGADVLCLKDGRIISGLTLTRQEKGFKAVFKNGEVLVPKELVVDAVCAADAQAEPKSDEEKAQAAKGMIRFESRWMSPKERDALLQKRIGERRKALEEMRSHQLWRNRYKETTAHFDFEHTVPPFVFKRYRDLMEAYFSDFANSWKVQQPKEGRLRVCFYGDETSYLETSGVGRGVLGYFKFVKPMELNIYYDRADPRESELVLFHEANHYLQKLININFAYPHFPGESLAEYYGASTYDPATKKLEVGLVQEGRLVEIQNDMLAGKMMDLEEMLKTDGMYEHYTWGWSLVHFLMNTPKYKSKFQAFVLGLANGNEVKREMQGLESLRTVRGEEVVNAFMKFLGLKDKSALKALEKEWHSYVKEKLKAVTPRGKELAAFSAAGTYPPRPIKAKRLLKEAIDGGSKNPLAYHRYAELLFEEDKNFEEAVKLWKQAIELDPLTSRYYSALGHAMKRHGDKEEGKRLVALAIEIDPDDPSLDFDLADIEDKIKDGGKDGK